MATVMHAGRDVIANDEGGWVFTPAVKPAKLMKSVVLARTTRAKLKRLASQPVTHQLKATFIGTQAECTSFRSRIAALYDGTVGTLSVPEFGSITQCCFTGDAGFSEQMACEPTEGGTPQFYYDVDLQIEEL